MSAIIIKPWEPRATEAYLEVLFFQWFISTVISIPHYIQIRGPLSLVSTTEELLDRKVAAPV
jgi:hypothetical protein